MDIRIVATLAACVGIFIFFKRKMDIAKKKEITDMLGFKWGDSIQIMAAWAKMLGLKRVSIDNNTSSITYHGKYPGIPIPGTFIFHLPGAKLDSLVILIRDPSGFTFAEMASQLEAKYKEPWDEEDNTTTWINSHSMIVLVQGDSGVVHLRFFNLENHDKNLELEDEHDEIIDAIFDMDDDLRANRKKEATD